MIISCGAEILENIGACLSETIAIGQQQDHGGNTPSHAEHGKQGPAPVVAHGAVGFVEQIADASVYSCRSASTGCKHGGFAGGIESGNDSRQGQG